ncbi:MAG: hypothetical protein ACJAS4_000571 [Bacteriovoracaceae bacterium]|jgi:hypothetical protein
MSHILLTLVIVLFTGNSFACKYDDISGADQFNKRKRLIDLVENPGLRLAWKDMKQKNKDHLIGTVDEVVGLFESKMCDKFSNAKFKKKHPGVDVLITKTDFKGYFITCLPKDRCKKVDLNSYVKEMEKPVFKATKNKPVEEIFEFTTSQGDNYNDGYVKARVLEAYGVHYDPKTSVGEFMDNELKKAIKLATGTEDFTKLMGDDPVFMEKLQFNIGHYRAGDFLDVDLKFRPLIKALDSMEIPFESSDNFDAALENAMKSDVDGFESGDKKLSLNEKYVVSRAQGGDDMTLVIKDSKGQIVKVVGADAKGLGMMNMTTRYEAYLNNIKNSEVSTNTTNDLLRVSGEAISVADRRMFSSMDAYNEILEYNLNNSGIDDIEMIIRKSHEEYLALQFVDEADRAKIPSLANLKVKIGKEDLMQMRAGAMNACGLSKLCVKDRITTIHNTLKLMEKAGIDGHFGDSCIGTEYWARKLGAKALRSLK